MPGTLHQRQEQQGPTTTATCYVVILSQARGRMKPRKDLVAVDSSAMDGVYSWDQINPQKTTHQIDRICSARVNCAIVSARSLGVFVRHTF